MKKRNLMFALCSAAVLGLVGCKDKEKPAEELKPKEEQQTQATVITQEIVDNTLSAMKSDFKMTMSASIEMEDEDMVGVSMFESQTLVEKHHFEEEQQTIETSTSGGVGYCINTVEFLSEPGQTQEILDVFELSMANYGAEKTVEGNVTTFSISVVDEPEYSVSNDDHSHFYYDYDADEEKYTKCLEFGDIDSDCMVYDLKNIFELAVGHGTLNNETGLIYVNNDDLEANDLSSEFEVIFSFKVVNKLITEFAINEIDGPEDDPFVEEVKIEYGAQEFTLPSEEDLIVCPHTGSTSTYCDCFEGKLYQITECVNCWDKISINEVTLNEEGKYDIYQAYDRCYEKVMDHFIASIVYNSVTNKIISVDFDCCYKDKYFISFKYEADGTTYYVSGRVFQYNDISYAYCQYSNATGTCYDVLEDAVVDFTNQTISGTLVKQYYVDQVLSF